MKFSEKEMTTENENMLFHIFKNKEDFIKNIRNNFNDYFEEE